MKAFDRLRRALFRVFPGAELAATLFALWMVVFVVRAHLPYIRFATEQNIDEGYLLAVGQRMLHGRMLPFVDGVAHSGPLFLFSAAPLVAWNEFSWLPVRILAAVCFAATALLTWAVGRKAGHSLAGAIGAAAIPLFCILRSAPFDGLAYNAEVPVNVFILASMFFLAKGGSGDIKAGLTGWAFWCGLFASFGGLSKQIGVLQSVVVAVGVLMVLATDTINTQQRRRAFGHFFVGAIGPVTLLVAWYAVNGGLKDLYYYVATYNRDIYMHFATQSRWALFTQWLYERPMETAMGLCLLAWAAARCGPLLGVGNLAQAAFQSWFPVTLFGLAVTGVIGARASLRDFDHYYNIAVPWFGLLVGLLGESAVVGQRGQRRVVFAQVLLLVPMVTVLEVMWSHKSAHLLGWVGRGIAPLAAPQVPAICGAIQKHTPAGESTFIWGFRPGLHVSCERRPATRFVFATVVSGYVPWYAGQTKEQEDQLTVPGSRELLLRELEQEKPRVIVDDGAWSLHGRPMVRYEVLAQYLAAHYRKVDEVEGMVVYLRSDS